ncbi:MAG: D-glycerate dehydrogenase [Acidobacteriota bacterium]|jgi:glyoxylate reductase|nr:D-glycerate dehydrogenase [Acidobacteriota bacterium]
MNSSRIVVISDSFHTIPEAVAMLKTSGHDIHYVPDLTPWRELAPEKRFALKEAHAVIMGRVMGMDAGALSLAPKLRVIALHTSGSDNVDLNEATRRDVIVTTVKGVNAEQCAEFALGLMLCVVRQILTGDRAIRSGLWTSRTLTSMDIHGSTVGVIGLGQIAKAFVTRARSFGVRILVHTRTPLLALEKELGIEYASLDEVLKTADIVCLFASLSRETRHMIGARELGLMKPSAFLINIARGELVDQDALLEVLKKGQIAGAGLDVFEAEPLLESPFFTLDNVVLTPHQAGLTFGGKAGAAIRAARNALEVLQGGVPSDAINSGAFATKD